MSANTALSKTHFREFHTYRIEWVPGAAGHIHWYLDDRLLYGIESAALNLTGSIVPEEPMYCTVTLLMDGCLLT